MMDLTPEELADKITQLWQKSNDTLAKTDPKFLPIYSFYHYAGIIKLYKDNHPEIFGLNKTKKPFHVFDKQTFAYNNRVFRTIGFDIHIEPDGSLELKNSTTYYCIYLGFPDSANTNITRGLKEGWLVEITVGEPLPVYDFLADKRALYKEIKENLERIDDTSPFYIRYPSDLNISAERAYFVTIARLIMKIDYLLEELSGREK